MKVLQINTVYGKGSTGKIAQGIHDTCVESGIKCVTAYRYSEKNEQQLCDTLTVSSWLDCHVHNRLVKYTLLQGRFSYIKTAAFLRRVKQYAPDLIHLHNLHGSYINLKLLFQFVKKHHIPVVWTLHDCWAFTGQCPHFTMARCDKWKNGCYACPQYHAIGDPIKTMYRLKKTWFTGVKDMTIVTPSEWLADLAKQSFLKDYPVKVIHNGIDLSVFQPTDSDFRQKYGCEDKKLILGVAFGWGARKGLDVFVELAKRLPEDYQIVLVGTNETVDKQLPANIISIHRTQNQKELAEIYSAADLFVNPTREETYPTVNMESLACGTPVLTFRTGGSPEILDEACGSVVDVDDVDSLEKEICRICTEKPYSTEDCLARARLFDMNDRFKEYVDLYENCSHSTKCSLQ